MENKDKNNKLHTEEFDVQLNQNAHQEKNSEKEKTIKDGAKSKTQISKKSSVKDYFSDLSDEEAIFRKANVLIDAFSSQKMTITEEKILALCFCKMRFDDKGPYAELTAGEIKGYLGLSGRIYETLKSQNCLINSKYVYYDDNKETFTEVNIVAGRHYEDGVLVIRFNNLLSKYLENIKTNYSLLDLRVIQKLKKVSALKLYENIRRYEYLNNPEKKQSYSFEMPLAQMKVITKAVLLQEAFEKTSDTKEKKKLEKLASNKDYSGLLEEVKEIDEAYVGKAYEDYNSYYRRHLEPAIKDIMSASDMELEITPIRSGRGGKTEAVRVTVTNGKSKSDIQKAALEDITAFFENISVSISNQNARTLLETADWNFDRVVTAYEVLAEQKDEVKSFMGFMIKAIREGWQPKKHSDIVKVKQFDLYEEGGAIRPSED